jgi:beta-glucuronidase
MHAWFMIMNANAQEFNNANAKDNALFPQQNDLRNKLNISGIWQ